MNRIDISVRQESPTQIAIYARYFEGELMLKYGSRVVRTDHELEKFDVDGLVHTLTREIESWVL